MLELDGIHAFYGSSHVLFGVSLQVGEGEVVALLGRNGMGKTTTVRTIMGIVRARDGVVRWQGRPIQAEQTHAIAQMGIGLVPEGRRIFPNLTTRENLVAMASNRHDRGNPWTEHRVFAMFPQLDERRDVMGSRLSGGEQQMLAIGRALMTNPRLLVLDEATEGLAPKFRRIIWDCIRALREARQSILVIDRNADALANISDRMYLIEKGVIVWYGSPQQFRDNRDNLQPRLSVGAAQPVH